MPTHSGRTPYAETEALLAVMEGRAEDAERIFREMYPGEARSLNAACESLSSIYWRVKDNEGFKGG